MLSSAFCYLGDCWWNNAGFGCAPLIPLRYTIRRRFGYACPQVAGLWTRDCPYLGGYCRNGNRQAAVPQKKDGCIVRMRVCLLHHPCIRGQSRGMHNRFQVKNAISKSAGLWEYYWVGGENQKVMGIRINKSGNGLYHARTFEIVFKQLKLFDT